MWPEGLIASFASDVKESLIHNVRPLGQQRKEREQGCSSTFVSRIEEDDDLTQRPQDSKMGENVPSRRRHLTIGRIVVANALGRSEWNGQQDGDLSSGCL